MRSPKRALNPRAAQGLDATERDESAQVALMDVPVCQNPRMRRVGATLAVTLIVFGALTATAGAIPAPWKNCSPVNKKYPHGIGKVGAHDKTSGTPVTSFKRSNRLYALAMQNNRGLDRDKDGIACEKP